MRARARHVVLTATVYGSTLPTLGFCGSELKSFLRVVRRDGIERGSPNLLKLIAKLSAGEVK